ncbi:MAG: carbamoyltransferase HypF [Desulfovibrionaceae bacterium]|nr:carbamoyltransferase HypF [Desulfovibrionaceae bacterium]
MHRDKTAQPDAKASTKPCAATDNKRGAATGTNTASAQTAVLRRRLLAQGQVQGVGFRPFIFRLAKDLALTGSVGNTSEGVCIEIQGPEDKLDAFPELLRKTLPPLARLTGLTQADMTPLADETEFTIVMSQGHQGHNVLISPDVGICADCEADMNDPANRRYNYAFTNCTNCGPRYTITRSIPYDREVTSMACFPMCPDCRKEYTNPLDRRFHAQPVACPACGPRLWFLTQEDVLADKTLPDKSSMKAAVERAADAIIKGKILALRGLGGFQLVCDARNASVVQLLRQRKKRPHKAFALMCSSLETIASLCRLSENEAGLLASPMRPAVVLNMLPHVLPEELAPDLATLAFMLPTTPLHIVLLKELAKKCRSLGLEEPVLVMTSGNMSGNPICLGNREAIQRLKDVADCFLLHDRDILCRVDDSVVACNEEDSAKPAAFFLRRARGYVPAAIPLEAVVPKNWSENVFAAGSDLKAACCFTRGHDAFVGQHTGDLEQAGTAEFYEEVVAHLHALLEVQPALVICDAHPDFYSSATAARLAQEWDVPLMTLQHHAAHAASVLAEHGITAPSLVLVLDGFGFGLDGTAWGGELIRMDLGMARWSRAGHFVPFAMPGGDAATRSPWRLALSLAGMIQDKELAAALKARWEAEKGKEAGFVSTMLQRHINSPLTSSCGRLFDAVAAQLGLCDSITYEGQAAIRLETLATSCTSKSLPDAADVVLHQEDTLLFDGCALFEHVCRLQQEGADPALAAFDFHAQLARNLARLVLKAHKKDDSRYVGLAGGVINNALLRHMLVQELSERGVTPLIPCQVPAGDGGISLGQAAFALASLRTKKQN